MGKQYDRGRAEVQSYSSAAAISAKITAGLTVVEVSLGEAATINLDNESTPFPGAEVVVKAASDATGRDVTFGTGFTGPVLAGVANKTKTQRFVYDGTSFIACGAPIQID